MKYFKAISLFLLGATLFSIVVEAVMLLLHVPQEVSGNLGFLLGLPFGAWLGLKLIDRYELV